MPPFLNYISSTNKASKDIKVNEALEGSNKVPEDLNKNYSAFCLFVLFCFLRNIRVSTSSENSFTSFQKKLSDS